jgi:hypothetical protein
MGHVHRYCKRCGRRCKPSEADKPCRDCSGVEFTQHFADVPWKAIVRSTDRRILRSMRISYV